MEISVISGIVGGTVKALLFNVLSNYSDWHTVGIFTGF